MEIFSDRFGANFGADVFAAQGFVAGAARKRETSTFEAPAVEAIRSVESIPCDGWRPAPDPGSPPLGGTP